MIIRSDTCRQRWICFKFIKCFFNHWSSLSRKRNLLLKLSCTGEDSARYVEFHLCQSSLRLTFDLRLSSSISAAQLSLRDLIRKSESPRFGGDSFALGKAADLRL